MLNLAKDEAEVTLQVLDVSSMERSLLRVMRWPFVGLEELEGVLADTLGHLKVPSLEEVICDQLKSDRVGRVSFETRLDVLHDFFVCLGTSLGLELDDGESCVGKGMIRLYLKQPLESNARLSVVT